MQKPLISVIIPVHNGENYLAEAIQSVINQTYPYVEIWVIDNGSIDRTEEITRSFSQVNYVRLEIANGAMARNEGIARSSGPVLAFLDHDDIWKPEKLEKQLALLESSPTIDAVICHQQMFLEPGHKKPGWVKQSFFETTQQACLPSALLVRRSVMEKMGSFNPDFSLSSDAVWFFKAKHTGIEVACVDEVLFLRRVHGDNISKHHCLQLQKELLVTIYSSLKERRESRCSS